MLTVQSNFLVRKSIFSEASGWRLFTNIVNGCMPCSGEKDALYMEFRHRDGTWLVIFIDINAAQ